MTPFYSVHSLEAGEPGFSSEIALTAVREFPEMHWQCSIPEAVERLVQDTRDNERVEITVRGPDGSLMAFAVLAEDSDSHVGEMLGVQWFYVLPEHRGAIGRRLMRYIVRFAQVNNYGVLAYTHRISEGRYEINYRKMEVHDG